MFVISSRKHHPDLTTGLAGRWLFNDGSGSSAADSSGLGRTATVYGVYTWGSGYVHPNPGYVYPPSSVSLAGATAGTVVVWLDTTALPASYMAAYNERAPTSYSASRFTLNVNNVAGTIALVTRVWDSTLESGGTGPGAVYTMSSWPAGIHMLAGAFDSIGVETFMDGVSVARTDAAVGTLGASVATNGIAIGGAKTGSGESSYGASLYAPLHEARVYYNRRLTPAHIAALYARGRS